MEVRQTRSTTASMLGAVALAALTLVSAGCGSGGGTTAASGGVAASSSSSSAPASAPAKPAKTAPAPKPLQGQVSAAYAASPPPLAGPATAWKTTPTVANESGDILRGADEWGGPTTAALTLYAMWDKQYLYLAANVVQDHPYSNTYTNGDVWQGDALWLYFTKSAGDTANAAKLTFAKAADGPEVYDWQGSQLVSGAKMQLTATGNTYWVAGEVPWSAIGVSPANGLTMGVNVGSGFGKSGFIDLNGKDPDNDSADDAPMTLQPPAKG